MTRILLVDDDVELCRMLAEYLGAEGFTVHAVHDGEQGAREARSGNYDAVILDVMLPRLNGIDALRRVRDASRVPIIMLTARGDDVDRIVGLELGADDYLPKPCNPRELVARLRAVLRRSAAAPATPAPGVIEVGDCTIRPGERIGTWRGRPLDLTSTEYNVLEALLRSAGQLVTKAELSERALGRPLQRYDRSIDMHVSSLRRKLGTLADGRSPIQTVRGAGYQFVSG
jgi:two-component system, OmpR family, response regulator